MPVSQAEVLKALKRIKGPDLQSNIVDLGLVSAIMEKDGRVSFSITVPAARAEELEPLRQAAHEVVSQVEGVTSATVVLTADLPQGAPRPRAESPRVAAARAGVQQAGAQQGQAAAPAQAHAHQHGHQHAQAAPQQGRAAGNVAGHQARHRGRLGQGRRRQVDGRGQSGARLQGARASRPASWTPTSTGLPSLVCSA